MASVPPAVSAPAVAVASAGDFSSAPRSIFAAAVVSTAVHEPAVIFSSPDGFTPAPLGAAVTTARAAAFNIKRRTAARVGSDGASTRVFNTHTADVEFSTLV